MEIKENFYITLDSSRNKIKSEKRKNSDFNIKIPNGITLSDDSKWEVGLVDSIISNKVFNINEYNNVFYLAVRNPRYPYRDPTSNKIVFVDTPYQVDWHFYDTNRTRKRHYNYRDRMLCQFRVEFRRKGISLSNMSYIDTYGTILEVHGKKKTVTNDYDNRCTLFKFEIPVGVYNDYKTLTAVMEELWNQQFGNIFAKLDYKLWKTSYTEWETGVTLCWKYETTPYYEAYDNRDLKLASNTTNNLGLCIPMLLGNMLGINTNQEIMDINNKQYYYIFPEDDSFIYKPYLYLGLTNLYVYTNIIDFCLVGSGQSQLLRHFTYNQEPSISTHRSIEFKHIHYLPITDKRINDIAIFIRNELGEPIHLTGEVCIVKLEFRRRPL